MRAAVIEQPGTVRVTTVDDPTPGPDDVVVAVDACGICGTDLHIMDGDFAPTPYPIVPGHEFSGEVLAVGRDVTSVTTGSAVAVDPSLFCGSCHYCALGRGNLCERWNAIGVTRNGACAEYALAPAANCYPMPDGVPLSHGALIEPLSCAVRGFDLLPRRIGEHYLIYGAGTMGLLMTQLAKNSGATSVSVVDLNPDRRAVASKLGADQVASSPDEWDRPHGWEVVVDCTGVIAAIEDALTRVRRGGTFQQFGVAPSEATASFSPFRVYNDEITIVGSMAVLASYGRAVEMIRSIDAETMITHAFGLDDYTGALDAFRAGTGRKLQVRPSTSVGS
ncbi:alcohol dehydrogenase catalytic domain-containing protein [Allosaccharopolyspora coralli]|uniref:Alcohol dehydrogenase catalytic domain-containing protein n=1 Tax=Allosaccharopolyspora coralli TaxID=2665642 RepID=A0A5Q3Q881_9PSEU|nr:zinc-dependent alcohol dehydrogenase family protein [Allosaccharopolyspora coralli]QGK70768.1 alcohol dehydrogenase catalytic domain-containing protein [Allosaccharopolyspora coralli]